MRRMPAKQRGLGLVSAIFLIMVVGLLTLAITQSVATAASAGAVETLSQRAFWVAESGAQLAVRRLFPEVGAAQCTVQNIDFSVLGANGCRATITCTTTLIGGNNYFAVESRGHCAADGDYVAERVVEVLVQS